MTIREYIRDQVFARRAQERGCLVIYDPVRRYRDVAASLATEKRRVIDVSQSIIEQRELTRSYSAEPSGGFRHSPVAARVISMPTGWSFCIWLLGGKMYFPDWPGALKRMVRVAPTSIRT